MHRSHGCYSSSVALNTLWKTRTHFSSDLGPQTFSMPSQLWAFLILCRYRILTIWFQILALSVLLLLLHISVRFCQAFIPPRHWNLCTALILYDYILMVAREITLFWKRPKRSWTFALFVANRYITTLGHIPFLVYSFWSPKTQADLSVSGFFCCLSILSDIRSLQLWAGSKLFRWYLGLHRPC